MTTVKVAQKPDEPEVVFEVLAQSIERIGVAVRALNAGRLKREVLVLLLHDYSKVGKPDVRAVLDGLDSLERQYLKPKAGK